MRRWEVQRSRLSHDLLANRLMQGLAAQQRLVMGELAAVFPPPPADVSGLQKLWDVIRAEARELTATFIDAMSPRSLFDEPPLCHCSPETKMWLMVVAHERWIQATRAHVVLAELQTALDAADESMLGLFRSFAAGRADVAAAQASVLAARRSMECLSRALTSMPRSAHL
jgi:hypothetical protein